MEQMRLDEMVDACARRLQCLINGEMVEMASEDGGPRIAVQVCQPFRVPVYVYACVCVRAQQHQFACVRPGAAPLITPLGPPYDPCQRPPLCGPLCDPTHRPGAVPPMRSPGAPYDPAVLYRLPRSVAPVLVSFSVRLLYSELCCMPRLFGSVLPVPFVLAWPDTCLAGVAPVLALRLSGHLVVLAWRLPVCASGPTGRMFAAPQPHLCCIICTVSPQLMNAASYTCSIASMFHVHRVFILHRM